MRSNLSREIEYWRVRIRNFPAPRIAVPGASRPAGFRTFRRLTVMPAGRRIMTRTTACGLDRRRTWSLRAARGTQKVHPLRADSDGAAEEPAHRYHGNRHRDRRRRQFRAVCGANSMCCLPAIFVTAWWRFPRTGTAFASVSIPFQGRARAQRSQLRKSLSDGAHRHHGRFSRCRAQFRGGIKYRGTNFSFHGRQRFARGGAGRWRRRAGRNPHQPQPQAYPTDPPAAEPCAPAEGNAGGD